MHVYREALRLLEQASDKIEATGDTLIVAHLALPIALLRDKLPDQGVAGKLG